MKLDFNEINHKYILRVVIFALFLYKFKFRNSDEYKYSVYKFVKKRLPWDIHLNIDIEKKEKQIERKILLDSLLYNENDDLEDLYTFKITFITPLKSVTMIVNLLDEERYGKFLFD